MWGYFALASVITLKVRALQKFHPTAFAEGRPDPAPVKRSYANGRRFANGGKLTKRRSPPTQTRLLLLERRNIDVLLTELRCPVHPNTRLVVGHALLYMIGFRLTSPALVLYHQLAHQCSLFSLTMLVNQRGFSPQSALKASLKLRLCNPQKPNSILSFFANHGFSISKRDPRILTTNPHKTFVPKFQFLRSKGASTSDIVRMAVSAPRFFLRSLDNRIIPTYQLVRQFFHSDEQVLSSMNTYMYVLCDSRVLPNIKLLIDNGVRHRDIARILRKRPSILCSLRLSHTIEELKELSFDPSTRAFCTGLLAKKSVNKAKWDEKVDTFKRWGWSHQHVLLEFKRQPYWTFTLSLPRRIVPRASVLQFLVLKGLRNKDATLNTPFCLPEKSFLEKFVECFKEDSSHLLKLYEEKLNLANDGDNMSNHVRVFFLEGLSIEKTYSKGLGYPVSFYGFGEEDACSATPFDLSDKMFLQKFDMF
ncbi:hypothetical protein RJT34_32225 [Clitoria ternatea]|uniref:Uncharacterized protein n=1 Tax=Clitoria ternatea TaxID=43366 RepID=A0AAN9EXX1_CLITE